MRETDRNTKEIVADMLSGDIHKIWKASCEICSLSQNHNKVMELAPFKTTMLAATRDIDLGGMIARNNRFLKRAFEIISFHENSTNCSCQLVDDESDPHQMEEDGYVNIIETQYYENSSYPDYYMVQCNNCKKIYKVEEREYHMTWWRWTPNF